MSFNLGTILKMSSAIKNPGQAINVALGFLSKKNPKLADNIKMMINSGKNPSVAIKEFAQKGEINVNQLNELKGLYKQLNKMGLKQQVPDSVWLEAENSIRSNNNNTNFSGGF